MAIRQCEWGMCNDQATLTVVYPTIVPGSGGKERSWDAVEILHVCDACAPNAWAEAGQYGRAGQLEAEAEAQYCAEWITLYQLPRGGQGEYSS